jgi:hypothetical protein
MSKARVLMFSLGLAFVLLLASPAALACGCQTVADGNQTPCAGCPDDFYYQEYCTVGCTYGYCITTGYGLCCRSRFITYNIDTNDCDPNSDCGDCGPARAHASSHLRQHARVATERTQDLAGLVRTSAKRTNNRVVFDDVVLVPDRCGHSYAAIYPRATSSQQSFLQSGESVPERVKGGGQ